jgi:hypothetical protein
MLYRVSCVCGSVGNYCESGLYTQKVVDFFLGDFPLTPISQEQYYQDGCVFLTERHYEDLKRNDDK